ncbi:MAG: TapB family protein [Promethearchaeota archaeon]
MKKRCAYNYLVIFGLICGILSLPTIVRAENSDVMVPEYAVGDYWTYDVDFGNNIAGEMRNEVLDVVDLQDFWNNTQLCYHFSSYLENTIQWGSQSFEIEIKGEYWERVSDLYMVKSISEMNASEDGGENLYQFQQTEVRSLTNISRYPLVLGREFNETNEEIYTFIIGENGINETIYSEQQGGSIFQQVVAINLETITTPAGTFDCFKISGLLVMEWGNSTTTQYYSEEVGANVWSEQVNSYIDLPEPMISTSELIAFKYSTSAKIPGYSYWVILFAFGIVGISVLRKRVHLSR